MGKEREYSVLFLEDEPTIREVLTEYMTISGYRVTGADRGAAAIRHWFAEWNTRGRVLQCGHPAGA